jgi:hypothetical protein
MRSFASLCLLAAAGLAGCTGTQQVSSSPPSVSYNPPTVSYQVTGGDLSQANAQAASYCQRYNATARLQNATSTHANYQCVGGTATPATTVVPGTAVAPGTVVTPAPARPLAAMPPGSQTVAYPVTGNDVSTANASAANYCRQYGRAAQFNGVTGGQAYYTCM